LFANVLVRDIHRQHNSFRRNPCGFLARAIAPMLGLRELM
jgi:hypothetical protein